jgi:hypothetical protein
MSSSDFITRAQNWPFRLSPSIDVLGELWRLIKLNGAAGPSMHDSGQTRETFPTVLIAAGNREMRQSLANHLRLDPCNVLQADSGARLWDAIISHSRPIHVLLVEMGLAGPDFADMAKQYRPGMRILFVGGDSDKSQPWVLPVGAAVAQARELLKAQK